MQGRERYTSRIHAGARFIAQRGLLKPFVWSLIDVEVHGKDNLRSLDGGFVVVSNHSSHLDTPLIMGSLPRRLARYLAAGAAADYWFKSWWKAAPTALFFNAFPVDRTGLRNRKGLAGNLLSDGVPLLLFPEGTRSRTGNMASFKPGAAALCISRNVPCLPVALVGSRDAMPSGRGLPKTGRPQVHVVFGSPMYARPDESAHRFSVRIAKVVRDMHDQIATTVGYPRLADYAKLAAEVQAAKDRAAVEKEKAAEEKAIRDKERRDKAAAITADRLKDIRDVADRARHAAISATKREPKDEHNAPGVGEDSSTSEFVDVDGVLHDQPVEHDAIAFDDGAFDNKSPDDEQTTTDSENQIP